MAFSKKITAVVLVFVGVVVTLIIVAVVISTNNKVSAPANEDISPITNFAECKAAGYPVMESYPRQCKVNDKAFTEDLGTIFCENRCGDGECSEVVCQGSGCPCAETGESCPVDCAPASYVSGNIGIANPASVYCEEQGGTLDIREDAEGGQYGICLLSGKECEEWAYYRGECQ